jgi:predicted DNA-binding transcriptional regulator AlpA
MTEVMVIECEAFQELVAMYKDLVRINTELRDENNKIKKRKLLNSVEVAEMVGYKEATIRLKKKEIGFFTEGKDVFFKPEDVDAWIERHYIKSRK